MRALLDRLHRRLRVAMLQTRAAQLQVFAGSMRCSTPQDAVYQAVLYSRAAEARCELAALERTR